MAAFFGCALRGVIVVPIDEAGAADFAQRVYRASGWKASDLFTRTRVDFDPGAGTGRLAGDVGGPFGCALRCNRNRPADILEIVFTSGTTAEPKGVVITHGNVLGNIAPLETEIQNI